jgi:quercetin dioxygenase-like cupin family protein
MKLYNLSNFTGGWFIGNFIPTIIPSNDVEVSIKRYNAGDHDQSHHHKEADEITVIVEGQVSMNKIKYHADDILWIEKNEITDFLALTDAITCVIKIPCVKNDKYLTK